jgi:hypothetical protein
VDLSAVRFRFMAWRGFVLATSRKGKTKKQIK